MSRKSWAINPRRRDMPLQVTDADQRNIQGIGRGLGVTEADQKSACQTWPLSDGNGSEILPSETGLLERAACHLGNVLDMGSRGEFRHHPAESLVHRLLR